MLPAIDPFCSIRQENTKIDKIKANKIVWLFEVYISINLYFLDNRMPRHDNANKTRASAINIIISQYRNVFDSAIIHCNC